MNDINEYEAIFCKKKNTLRDLTTNKKSSEYLVSRYSQYFSRPGKSSGKGQIYILNCCFSS